MGAYQRLSKPLTLFCVRRIFLPLCLCVCFFPQSDICPISSLKSYYQESVKIPFLYNNSLYHQLETALPSLNVRNILKFLVALVNLFFVGLHKKAILIYGQSTQRENICGLLYVQLNVCGVSYHAQDRHCSKHWKDC